MQNIFSAITIIHPRPAGIKCRVVLNRLLYQIQNKLSHVTDWCFNAKSFLFLYDYCSQIMRIFCHTNCHTAPSSLSYRQN